MRKIAKHSMALFVLLCLVAFLFPSCGGGLCAAFFKEDKARVLIAQLQGQCCTYKADPYGSCQKMSEPYVPIPWLPYWCVSSAARCLGAMGEEAKQAVPALIQALETGPKNYDTGDGSIPTRNDITLALGKIGDPRAVKPLITALHSPQPADTRIYAQTSRKPIGQTAAIEALGLVGPAAREAVPDIIPFLKDSSPYRFRAAVKALGQIKDKRAIPVLKEALNHLTDAAAAAEALGEFGSQAKPALPTLIKMIEASPQMKGSVLVIGAIREISGNQDYLPAFEQNRTKGWSQIMLIADKHMKKRIVSLPDKTGAFYIALSNGEKLYIQLKLTATNPSSQTGEIWLEKDGEQYSRETFASFTQMRQLFETKLTTQLREATP